MSRFTRIAIPLLLLVTVMLAQSRRRGYRPPTSWGALTSRSAEFTFVRTVYNSAFGWMRGGSWATDFPEADYHFIVGVQRWSGTNLDVSAEPLQIPILDKRIFQYPLLYFAEPGYMELSDGEARQLREYVLRGGFLFLDDFWGEYEWENVKEQMRRILPEYTIRDLPLSHFIFRSYFDIGKIVQVPGIGSWVRWGITHEKGGIIPHYMGIEDHEGQLLAFISRNSDLGDAWEWIDDPAYPEEYGLAAYRLGVNVIIYAMSH